METSDRHPVGKFVYQPGAPSDQRARWVQEIRELPAAVGVAVRDLAQDRLDTCYREGGWTVRQVVHHLADSHMNAFTRFKLALTEERPRIKPYDQDAWAALPDTRASPIESSLSILEGLHARWVTLIGGMGAEDWQRVFEHPERGPMTLDHTLQLYAWHGRHHTAHITTLRKRRGW